MKLFLIITLLVFAAALSALVVHRTVEERKFDQQAYEMSRERGKALFLYFQNIEAANLTECFENKIIPFEMDAAS